MINTRSVKSKRSPKWRNKNWFDFAKKVKERDNYQCLHCGRTKDEVVLQVHHKIYRHGYKEWEYPLSDCITVCKGCHAIEHGIIEPSSGWILISIDDLGSKEGICERRGCGKEIQFEHLIYHPKFGYKKVGSTCVDYLTDEDKFISKTLLKYLKNISDFVKNSEWRIFHREKGAVNYSTNHLSNYIYIKHYIEENYFQCSLGIKKPGFKPSKTVASWECYEYTEKLIFHSKTLNQVKELGYILLKEKISADNKEKEILINLYQSTK